MMGKGARRYSHFHRSERQQGKISTMGHADDTGMTFAAALGAKPTGAIRRWGNSRLPSRIGSAAPTGQLAMVGPMDARELPHESHPKRKTRRGRRGGRNRNRGRREADSSPASSASSASLEDGTAGLKVLEPTTAPASPWDTFDTAIDDSSPPLTRQLSNTSADNLAVDSMFGFAIETSAPIEDKARETVRRTGSGGSITPLHVRLPVSSSVRGPRASGRFGFARDSRRDLDRRVERERANRSSIQPSYIPPQPKGGVPRVLNRKKVRVDTVYGPHADDAADQCREMLGRFGAIRGVNTCPNKAVGAGFFDCYTTFVQEKDAMAAITALHGNVMQVGLFPVRLMFAWDKPECVDAAECTVVRSAPAERAHAAPRAPPGLPSTARPSPTVTVAGAAGVRVGARDVVGVRYAAGPTAGTRWGSRTPTAARVVDPVAAPVGSPKVEINPYKLRVHAIYGPTAADARTVVEDKLREFGSLESLVLEEDREIASGYFIVHATFGDTTAVCKAIGELNNQTIQVPRPIGKGLTLEAGFDGARSA